MTPNALITGLNQWGEAAWDFARPMLLQSTLVIIVLWLADAGLRKLVSARVRHTFLLLVLVKLVLPPSLAWPVSPFYWLGALDAPVVAPATPLAPVTVTYSDPVRVAAPPALESRPAPLPALTLAGGSVLLWGLGVAVLGVCLARRSRLIHGMMARSRPAPERLAEQLDDCRGQLGLRGKVELRITDEFSSPAVCGLWRPVILLPERLVQRLTPAGARAVLLHELTHVKRGDLWLNYAQTILQIIYWFHPLLWLANGSIRRVREQAVDEAVMEALRDEAETYPETLVAVAKEAIQHPRLALGLVGILESRQALRQRLDRLTGPSSGCFMRKSLAWHSLAMVAAALLLPMAQGGQSGRGVASGGTAKSPETAPVIYLTTRLLAVSEADLATLGMGASEALVSNGNLARAVGRAELIRLSDNQLNLPRGIGPGGVNGHTLIQNGQTARIHSRQGAVVSTSPGDLHETRRELNCDITPVVAAGRIELTISGTITDSGDLQPVSGGVMVLNPQPAEPAAAADRKNTPVYSARASGYVNHGLGPASGSVNPGQTFLVLAPGPAAGGQRLLLAATPMVIDASLLAGAATPSAAGTPGNPGGELVTRVFALGSVDLAASIRARWTHPLAARAPDDTILMLWYLTFPAMADEPEVFHHEKAANRLVVRGTSSQVDRIERKLAEELRLMTRTFHCGTNDLVQLIRSRWQHPDATEMLGRGETELLRAYFLSANPQTGQLDAIFFDRAKGQIFARGTGAQLDGVEKELNTRLLPRTQLVIEARWAEIPANAKKASPAPGTVGVLSSEQAAFVVDSVKQTASAKLVALPKVVTLERRSAEIQVPDEINGDIPGGLKLNVLPLVAADGIGLGAELTVRTAAGDLLVPNPAAFRHTLADPDGGNPKAFRVGVPVPLRTLLFDGQTLMVPLGFRKAGAGEGEGTRHSFLLVSLTLIDPAGNRLHTDDQLAAFKTTAPPQITW